MEKKKGVIKTERLILKLFNKKDKQSVINIFLNKEIKKTYMLPDFNNYNQAEELFNKMLNYSLSDNHFIYGIHYNNKLIGFINDCGINDSLIELGYVIIPEYQGHGFASEALQNCIHELFRIGFVYIRAGYFIENIASCRVMQKCGMKKIDIEEDIQYKGVLHHCHYYEISKV